MGNNENIAKLEQDKITAKIQLEQIEKEQETRSWFENIMENETFEVEWKGKKHVFRKYFPMSINDGHEKKSKKWQSAHLISYLSKDPKLPHDLIMNKVPPEFVALVSEKISEFNKINDKAKAKLDGAIDSGEALKGSQS